MPDPDRLLRTLNRAVLSCRETPGRRGRVVRLEGAAEVLAVGDLHGNLENFRLLLARADLARNPARHFVLQELIHGLYRYPAGGDKSHQLLDLVAALKCQYPHQVHFLLGNHELAQATGRRISKGDEDLNQAFREGVATAYGPRAAEVYAAYQQFFAAIPVLLRTDNRIVLSHSLPPASMLDRFDFAALQRDESTEADLLITGHIPCDRGFDLPNDRQLVLDSLGTPAAYCLFPTDRPLTHAELIAHVSTL